MVLGQEALQEGQRLVVLRVHDEEVAVQFGILLILAMLVEEGV